MNADSIKARLKNKSQATGRERKGIIRTAYSL